RAWHRRTRMPAPTLVPSLTHHFVDLARQNLWANARLYAACARLTDGERRAPGTAYFKSIHRTLAHILVVDDYYVGTLVDGDAVRPDDDSEDRRGDFERLRLDQAVSDRRLLAFCEALVPARLTQAIELAGEAGARLPERIGIVLPHLFLHQVHHRGQVH